ncbi:MAG: hypothetical protein JWN14_2639 [Chthonomonadales bacterium]|nr:hypothetical protein [Chthonomonadales bacterium]
MGNAVILFKELQEHGYRGGYSILKNYLRLLPQSSPIHILAAQATVDAWVLRLLQGEISTPEIAEYIYGKLDNERIEILRRCVLDRPMAYRNRAMTVLLSLHDTSQREIARCLYLHRKTVLTYIREFSDEGIEALLGVRTRGIKKSQDERYKAALFAILHAPPSDYDINRTTWRMEDMRRIMAEQGHPISCEGIRRIIRDAGYRVRKARKVLTSRDPAYKEKVQAIQAILSQLGPQEKFFSIDEFGPFAVQLQGGSSLVLKGETKTIPQWQTSKGSLLLTGALELSTNQMTHFYSEHKNTEEMVKLLKILLVEYAEQECLYLSWDAASWHASKLLYDVVKEVNSPEYRATHTVPIVKLAPLPSGAQFLNVIESVFSGMARAIIHNSDYQDVAAAKVAIDRHFAERNAHFREHPKRAGNKIWGKERVEPKFSESNNCKDPHY